uniref:Uncharacterized protein n=1 Tax=Macaca fascicularis TaxID=9541 RepID=Q95LT9_MACFA|nr:hypothetical protein [Macaca fascicularis]
MDVFFNFTCSTADAIVVSGCISLMNDDVLNLFRHFFFFFFAMLYTSLVKCLVKTFTHFSPLLSLSLSLDMEEF